MPDVDDLVVALALSDDAGRPLLLDFQHLGPGLIEHRALGFRNHHVLDADRNSGLGRIEEGDLLQVIEHLDRQIVAVLDVAVADEILQAALLEQAVDERDLFRQVHVEDDPADGGFDYRLLQRLDFGVDDVLIVELSLEIGVETRIAHADHRVRFDDPLVQRDQDGVEVGERLAFSLRALLRHREVVAAENQVLRRHCQRTAVRRRQDVVRRQHQDMAFDLRLGRQRHVHRHLVAVEVGVERRADQGMDLDRLALDQLRLKRLDAETMQGGRAVEHHRVVTNDLLERVPDLVLLALDHLLRRFDGTDEALQLQLVVDERFEQLERHLFRQAALAQRKLGADDDDRTSRVVDPLAEQVLPEPTLLALQGVRERLERPVVRALEDPSAAPVVEQGVHRLLQHALLVSDDDFRRPQFQQLLQPVVAVDDAAVEIVQVAGREASAVQRNERAQFRRNHRQDVQDHPRRLVAAAAESIHDLEALGGLQSADLAGLGAHHDAQLLREVVHLDPAQQLLDRLGAHLGDESAIPVLVAQLAIALLGQQLLLLELGVDRVDDDIALEVEDPLQVPQRDVEQMTDAARQTLEEPDVRHRAGELDVTHALAANARAGDLDAALVADHSTMLHALVLAAQAFPVGDRPEDLGAEEPVTLRLESPVVDGLCLGDFTTAPGADLLRRRDRDLDRVEILQRSRLVKTAKGLQYRSSSDSREWNQIRFSEARRPDKGSGAHEPAH